MPAAQGLLRNYWSPYFKSSMGRAYPTCLIGTKVTLPALPDHLVHRPHLVQNLEQVFTRRVCLLSAPAGYGKTGLLLDFAYKSRYPVCWYNLDTGDSDLHVFATYLLACLRQQFPPIGRAIEVTLRRRDWSSRSIDHLVALFVQTIQTEVSGDFVILLDDYHELLEESAVHTFFNLLFQYAPDNAHFVISGRGLPKLNFTRLVARRLLHGISYQQMRLNMAEARQFLEKKTPLKADDHQLEAIVAETEGWATGIVLGTDRSGAEMVRISCGGDDALSDYLAHEVLEKQPEDIQRFLLEMSLLDNFTSEECAALLDYPQANLYLEEIERRRLFISRPDETHFRLHPLFRAFLRSRLKNQDRAWFCGLNWRAASMAQDAGNLVAAVDYLLEARAITRAAYLMADIVEDLESHTTDLCEHDMWPRLEKWLAALPEETLDNIPVLWRAWSRLHLRQGRLSEALKVCGRVQELLGTDPKAYRGNQPLEQDRVLQRFRQRMRNDLLQAELLLRLGELLQAETLCQQIEAALGDLPITNAVSDRSAGMDQLALLALWSEVLQIQGRLDAARRLLERGLQLAAEASSDRILVRYLLRMGDVCLEQGAAVQAERFFERAEVLILNILATKPHLRPDYERLKAEIKLGCATAALALGEIETVRQHLQTLPAYGSLLAQQQILRSIFQAKLQLEDDPQTALSALAEASQGIMKLDDCYGMTKLLLVLADTFRAAGQAARARVLASEVKTLALKAQMAYLEACACLLLGELAIDRKDKGMGVADLQHAMELFGKCEAVANKVKAGIWLAYATGIIGGEPAKILDQVGHDLRQIDDRRLLGANTLACFDGFHQDSINFSDILPISKSKQRRYAKRKEMIQAGVRAFGRAEVEVDGQQISKADWDSMTTKELFYFFMQHPRGLRKEQVLEQFWPDSDPEKANNSFHSANYRLRKALFDRIVLYEDGWYVVNRQAIVTYDVWEFEALVGEAQSGNLASDIRAERYQKATALYQGDFLEEFYSNWCVDRREELERQYLMALEWLGDYQVRTGIISGALECYRSIVARDTYREDVHVKIMEGHLALGDRVSAIRQYQILVDTLQKDLGICPMPQTESLFRRTIAATGRGNIRLDSAAGSVQLH
ncbi:MAG: hypothetical protein EXR62_10410 [Chloroflexi bacterium]|nr:hypothetical protein [Chloroflexota bacterium]